MLNEVDMSDNSDLPFVDINTPCYDVSDAMYFGLAFEQSDTPMRPA